MTSRFVAALFWVMCELCVAHCAGAAETIKRLAFVTLGQSSTAGSAESAFWARLEELGWIEGRNLLISRYFAKGDTNRLPKLIDQVIQGHPDVIVAPGSQAALAVMRATSSIAIVSIMGDPVGTGLATSLSRPGGNVTGVSAQTVDELPGKWIELLREVHPHLTRVAVTVNPDNPASNTLIASINRAASSSGITVVVLEARSPQDFVRAIAEARRQAQALIVTPESTAIANRKLITAEARKHRLLAIYSLSDFVDAGGLMSYGPDLATLWRRVGDYADRILRGAVAAEVPIEQPTTFSLVINLETARAIGTTVPQSLLVRANEVLQ